MIDYARIIRRYAELFPLEVEESLRELRPYLESVKAGNPVNSKDFNGHLTASALFVDVPARRILLLRHDRYLRDLQPGGHIESPDELPQSAAVRKLRKETPFTDDDVRYLPYDYDAQVPIDIDSHSIPDRNDHIKEPRHVHHDLRYVFLNTKGGGLREAPSKLPADAQPGKYRWVDFEALQDVTSFKRLYEKLQRFLSKDLARRRFYIGLTNEHRPPPKLNTIVVTHVLGDSFEFLEALHQTTNLLAVVPKPKSLKEAALKRVVEAGINVVQKKREELLPELKRLLDAQSEKSVLLDIGGWFAPTLTDLPHEYHQKIWGIVEDTRNGQTKYEQIALRQEFPFPVWSVAESQLKENEDFLVGQSVVFSTDAILRECGLLLEYLDCVVIGYGKIGRSIAHHLRIRGVKPIVVEIDPLRQVEAMNALCTLRSGEWANQNADVIFCATGSQATGILQFRQLRPGAYVTSVTSSDDEFDLRLVGSEYKTSKTSCEHVTRYDGHSNHFYLLNGGNAVNFIHGAVLWEFIQLVRGGILVAAKNLVEGRQGDALRHKGAKGLGHANMFELPESQQAAIAQLWLETVHLGVKL